MARTIFDWKQTTAPLFLKVWAPPYTHTGARRFYKHLSKSSFQLTLWLEDSGVEWQNRLWNSSKIMEATSLTACDQGLIKRVHVCWGPALSFLYCTDFVYSYISEILLKTPVNIEFQCTEQGGKDPAKSDREDYGTTDNSTYMLDNVVQSPPGTNSTTMNITYTPFSTNAAESDYCTASLNPLYRRISHPHSPLTLFLIQSHLQIEGTMEVVDTFSRPIFAVYYSPWNIRWHWAPITISVTRLRFQVLVVYELESTRECQFNSCNYFKGDMPSAWLRASCPPLSVLQTNVCYHELWNANNHCYIHRQQQASRPSRPHL